MKSKLFITTLEVAVLFIIMKTANYYFPEVLDKGKITILISATYIATAIIRGIQNGIEKNFNKRY